MKFITYQQYIETLKNNTNVGLKETGEIYNLELCNNEKINKIQKKYDKTIKKVLSKKEEFINFINDFMDLKEKVNENQVEKCSSKFITRENNNEYREIIFKLKDKPIYFLIQHQTVINEDISFKIWKCVGELISRESIIQKTYLNKDKIYPIVIPILIYTGSRKCNLKTKLDSLNNLKYNLIMLQNYTFEELLKKNTLFGNAMTLEMIDNIIFEKIVFKNNN